MCTLSYHGWDTYSKHWLRESLPYLYRKSDTLKKADCYWSRTQSTYFCWSWNRVSVSAHSAGAYTATLPGDGKCNERGWACTPHPHQPGLIYPHDGMYARKQPVLLCVLCGQGCKSPCFLFLLQISLLTWIFALTTPNVIIVRCKWNSTHWSLHVLWTCWWQKGTAPV